MDKAWITPPTLCHSSPRVARRRFAYRVDRGRTARAFVLPRSVFHRLSTDAIPSVTKAAVGRRWETRCRIDDRPVRLEDKVATCLMVRIRRAGTSPVSNDADVSGYRAQTPRREPSRRRSGRRSEIARQRLGQNIARFKTVRGGWVAGHALKRRSPLAEVVDGVTHPFPTAPRLIEDRRRGQAWCLWGRP